MIKKIEGTEYSISIFGNVYNKHGKMIKSHKNKGDGYYTVDLYINKKRKTKRVHILMADTFLPERGGLVIDHINNDKSDNSLNNLQLITQRLNTSKDKKNKTSKYTGVDWNKSKNKWRSRIYIDGKNEFLGYFDDEYDAHLAYKNKLNQYER